jgi:hypothetical protein
MPKKLINNYVFYKFTCLNDNIKNCYIGSTANLKNRKIKHKSACNNENDKAYNYNVYKMIRENGGWNNWSMVVIEEIQDLTLTQARMKEEEHRIKLKADMNSCSAYLSDEARIERDKEYRKKNYEKNKEKEIKQAKQYRNEHIEATRQREKKYYEENRAKIRQKRKEYEKIYRENNKEKIAEAKKKCYINNKINSSI